ncbi:MAG TPA: hypothetical protein VE242_11950 [Chthoniobacterales bacterium]|nr:hypothetical protein [Chthoniobacterales bacterium]
MATPKNGFEQGGGWRLGSRESSLMGQGTHGTNGTYGTYGSYVFLKSGSVICDLLYIICHAVRRIGFARAMGDAGSVMGLGNGWVLFLVCSKGYGFLAGVSVMFIDVRVVRFLTVDRE